MDGPLTPPPTSQDTPIVDASVTGTAPSANATVQAAPPEANATPAESPHLPLFPPIAALQANADYQGIIQAAERADLVAVNDEHPTRLVITAPLVLSYLIVDDLKFALTRLPTAVASLPLAQAVFNLFASAWERRYEHVYRRAEVLFNLVQQADFPHPDVGAVIAGLVKAFLEAFRQRTFALVSRAYTSIPLPLAQTYFGLPNEQFLSVVSAQGWQFDASTQVLTPAPVARAAPSAVAGAWHSPSTLSVFDVVTDSVARLEA
ncbi:COP9 signalosome [Gloeopeniophorella convolvens]|nr:COP9 signalosome [Gloeopeniophorella convolvens]